MTEETRRPAIAAPTRKSARRINVHKQDKLPPAPFLTDHPLAVPSLQPHPPEKKQ